MEWLTLVHGTTTSPVSARFAPGDDVRVWYRILEQGKERLGQFEGTVLRRRGSRTSKTFTVRRLTHGEGVERTFPLDAKVISRIDVLRQGKVQRARLYFLRTLVGRSRITAAENASAPASTQRAQGDSSSPMSVSQANASGEPSVRANKSPNDGDPGEPPESAASAAERSADRVTPRA